MADTSNPSSPPTVALQSNVTIHCVEPLWREMQVNLAPDGALTMLDASAVEACDTAGVQLLWLLTRSDRFKIVRLSAAVEKACADIGICLGGDSL